MQGAYTMLSTEWVVKILHLCYSELAFELMRVYLGPCIVLLSKIAILTTLKVPRFLCFRFTSANRCGLLTCQYYTRDHYHCVVEDCNYQVSVCDREA